MNASQLPVFDDFLFARITGRGVVQAGGLSGSPGKGDPGILITNVRVEDVDVGATKGGWSCVNVTGSSARVVPPISRATCPQLA